MESHDHDPPSRRTVLVATAGGVVAVPLLAACGGGDTTAAPTSTATSDSAAAGPLAKVSDIPVGGAVSATTAAGDPIIIAQPTAGEVVAFSAICTHRGCTVAPDDKRLLCPCHGSTYDLATGDNTAGPAPSPLAKVTVTVEGDEVVEG